jgi:hypothetical protein
MNEPWPISHAEAHGFVLTILAHTTVRLTAGLLASWQLIRHAARPPAMAAGDRRSLDRLFTRDPSCGRFAARQPNKFNPRPR